MEKDNFSDVDNLSSDAESSESNGLTSTIFLLRDKRLPRKIQKRTKTALGACSVSIFQKSRWLRIVKDTILMSFAFLGLLAVFQYLVRGHEHGMAIGHSPERASEEKQRGCDCGESVGEAISRGCEFDGLAMAWLPPHCFDIELSTEFASAGDGPNGTWVYYADSAHTTILDLSDVKMLGNNKSARVHMSDKWHKVHCIFYWRKQYRARFNGKMVEPRSDSERHINHCGHVLMMPNVGTVSGVELNTNESGL